TSAVCPSWLCEVAQIL
ncbi:hypothetical protein BVRB_037210, partial [Beta vulgaris subsp. vulgaris]